MGGYNLSQEDVVGAQMNHVTGHTLHVHGALLDHGRLDELALLLGEVAQLPLVHLAAGGDAAVVGLLGLILAGDVDDEVVDFLQHGIGITGVTDGNVHHGGVGADNSAIGDGDDVRIAFLVRTGHHESRNGGYRRMGADILLSHNKIAS